jgi:hypothetical protein
MTERPREQLRQQQVELIQVLQGHVEAPPEFNEKQISAAAQALFRKRSGEVKKTWPALAGYLGKRFSNLFAVFLAAHPSLQPDPIADGYLFTVWLSSRERLPSNVIVAVRLHEAERTGRPHIWWQPDRRKAMIVWRWRGRAHHATIG